MEKKTHGLCTSVYLNLICFCIISTAPLIAGAKIQVRDRRPLVDGVFVNGHGPYRFLLDTGSNVNLIDTRLAKKIGMSVTFESDLVSSAGKTRVTGSDGNEVSLDIANADRQKFVFSELDAIHNSSPDIQGVLGEWFLSRFDYLLDLQGKHLEFGKQAIDGTRSQFRVINARPVISTSAGELVLDSAAARLVLFGFEGSMSNKAQLRTVAASRLVGLLPTTLAIEGRNVWRGEAVAIPNRAEPGVDGLMPLSLFKSIYVCNSEGYVVLR